MLNESIRERLPLVRTLLNSIQRILHDALPDFVNQNMKKKEVRAVIAPARLTRRVVRQFQLLGSSHLIGE